MLLQNLKDLVEAERAAKLGKKGKKKKKKGKKKGKKGKKDKKKKKKKDPTVSRGPARSSEVAKPLCCSNKACLPLRCYALVQGLEDDGTGGPDQCTSPTLACIHFGHHLLPPAPAGRPLHRVAVCGAGVQRYPAAVPPRARAGLPGQQQLHGGHAGEGQHHTGPIHGAGGGRGVRGQREVGGEGNGEQSSSASTRGHVALSMVLHAGC